MTEQPDPKIRKRPQGWPDPETAIEKAKKGIIDDSVAEGLHALQRWPRVPQDDQPRVFLGRVVHDLREVLISRDETAPSSMQRSATSASSAPPRFSSTTVATSWSPAARISPQRGSKFSSSLKRIRTT